MGLREETIKKIHKYLRSLERGCPHRQGAPRDFEIPGFIRIDKFAMKLSLKLKRRKK